MSTNTTPPALLLPVLALLACGGSSNHGSPEGGTAGTDGGTTSPDGAMVSHDGGSSSGGDGSTSPRPPPAPMAGRRLQAPLRSSAAATRGAPT